MIEGFLEVIRNVGIFIICAQAIIHFRPKASYEKYLKVLVSIIVLVMLMVPCFQALGDMESFLNNMNRYESFLSGQMVWEEFDNEVWTEREYGYTLPDSSNPVSAEADNENVKVNSRFYNEIETIVIEPVEVIE